MNRDYTGLKSRAINLRKKGLSYGDIGKTLNLSKSTLSYWLKTVPLKPEYRERLYTKRILNLSLGWQSQKLRREREVEQIMKNASEEINLPLSDDTLRLMGAIAYWAEGNKVGSFEITNSDPLFILFMIDWLRKVFGVKSETLKARLNIYPQQDEKKVKGFWSELTGVPIVNFGKSFVKPLNKNYKKNNLYYGTIKIYVPRGIDTKYRVFGWIKKVLQNTSPKVESIETKWGKLREQVRKPVNI